MKVHVNPGFANSSDNVLAQKPLVKRSLSTVLWLWICLYPQWWLVRSRPWLLTISAVHPPLKWTTASFKLLWLML